MRALYAGDFFLISIVSSVSVFFSFSFRIAKLQNYLQIPSVSGHYFSIIFLRLAKYPIPATKVYSFCNKSIWFTSAKYGTYEC